jgi:hypothetical protein
MNAATQTDQMETSLDERIALNSGNIGRGEAHFIMATYARNENL